MSSVKEKWSAMPKTVQAATAYTICSTLQQCVSFVTLPLFARLLTKEQYGQVTVYISWQGIFQILLTLNLAYGSFSTAMMKFEKDRDGYISAVQGICIALSAVFFAIYFPLRGLWNDLFELPTGIICILVAEVLSLTAFQLWSGKKRFEYKYISVVIVTLVTSFLSPVVQYILVVNSTEKGYARIVGSAAMNILAGVILFTLNMVRGKKALEKKYWSYALMFNVPLLAYYLSQVVFNQSDRIMISHMEGKDKAASYGVAYGFAMLLTFVLNAINNSYLPWFYEKIKEEKEEENRSVSLGIAGLMAVLVSGVIWFAPEIILIMAGSKYSDAVQVVPPVAVSLLLLFYAQLFINVEFYYEERKSLVYASIGAAVLNLVTNWVFIRMFGFVAAAYTTLASYIVFAVANYFAMKKVLLKRGKKDVAYDYKGLIYLFLAFAVLSALAAVLYPILLARIGVSVIVLGLLVIKRRQIMAFLGRLRGGAPTKEGESDTIGE